MKIIHKIALSLSVLLLLSCSKDFHEGTEQVLTQPDPATYACADGCNAAELVHHPAIEATVDRIGNVDFWECPHCGKAYSDAWGRQPLKGYAYLLPTGFLKDVSSLAGLAKRAPATKGNAVASAELAMSIISLCAGIATLGVTIASLCSSIEDVEAAYENLAEEANLTEMEIELMAQYYEEIEYGIDDLMVKTTELNSSLQTMNSSMTELNATLAEVDKTLVQLLVAIRALVDDVRADLILDNRHLLHTSLRHPMDDCFTTLSEYLNTDMEGLASADTYKDTLDVFRTFSDHQTMVLDEWALAENDRVADVMTLISTFNAVSYNYRENIPAFLEHYANRHFSWEHHAITFRKAYLNEDRYLMSMGYYLSKMYFSLNPDIDKVYAQKRLELMTEQFEQAEILFSKDSLEMAAAYAGHRLCNVTGKKYDVKPHLVSFKDYCDKTFVESGSDFINNGDMYNSILYDMPEESSITREDVEMMERFYFGDADTMEDLYFGVGVGGMELLSDEAMPDPQLVVPYAADIPVQHSQTGDWNQEGAIHHSFKGMFHNPFLSDEFLTSAGSEYHRDDWADGTTKWYSWPDCFTPIYYPEQ